jgi:hypothetical protein
MSTPRASVRRRIKQSLVAGAVPPRHDSKNAASGELSIAEDCPTVRPGSFSLRITKSGRLQVLCFELPRPRTGA